MFTILHSSRNLMLATNILAMKRSLKIKKFLREYYSKNTIQESLDHRYKTKKQEEGSDSPKLKHLLRIFISVPVVVLAFYIRHEWQKINLVETSDNYLYGIGLPIVYYVLFAGLLIFATISLTMGITGLIKK